MFSSSTSWRDWLRDPALAMVDWAAEGMACGPLAQWDWAWWAAAAQAAAAEGPAASLDRSRLRPPESDDEGTDLNDKKDSGEGKDAVQPNKVIPIYFRGVGEVPS